MVSNNLLASLLVLAIIVSVAGIYSILSTVSLGQIPFAPSGVTGAATGTTQVNIGTVAAISLIVNTVDFQTMVFDENNDTTDNSPGPFTIQNDGNVDVNVTINATALWSQSGYAETNVSYMFKCGDSGEWSCTAESLTTYTNMPVNDVATLVIADLTYGNSVDLAEVEINVTVPPAEPSGSKSSTVTFTGFQA